MHKSELSMSTGGVLRDDKHLSNDSFLTELLDKRKIPKVTLHPTLPSLMHAPPDSAPRPARTARTDGSPEYEAVLKLALRASIRSDWLYDAALNPGLALCVVCAASVFGSPPLLGHNDRSDGAVYRSLPSDHDIVRQWDPNLGPNLSRRIFIHASPAGLPLYEAQQTWVNWFGCSSERIPS